MFQFIRTDDSRTDDSRTDDSRTDPSLRENSFGNARPDQSAVSDDLLRVHKLDRAGATASFLCAIHCALMPLVVTLLPLLGLSFLASEPVEWALLASSATLGSLSLCLGFRKHRKRRVFMVLGIALAIMVAGRIFHERHFGVWGPVLMVIGGLMMMSVHLLNHRLCHACTRCSSHECG